MIRTGKIYLLKTSSPRGQLYTLYGVGTLYEILSIRMCINTGWYIHRCNLVFYTCGGYSKLHTGKYHVKINVLRNKKPFPITCMHIRQQKTKSKTTILDCHVSVPSVPVTIYYMKNVRGISLRFFFWALCMMCTLPE